MTIEWTQELRERVYPSRKHPNPGFLARSYQDTGITYPYEAKAARKDAAEYWAGKDDQKRAKQGLAKNPPAWKPKVEAALARGKAPKKESPLDIDVEAATVTLEMCPLFAAMPYWITAGGLVFALRALIRTTEITSSWAEHGYGDHGLWIVESRAIGFDRPEDNCGAWEILRALLAEAIEPVYDEAHGIADEARLASVGLTPNESVLQVMIPFVFPDEAAWAKAGAASAIALAKQRKRASTAHLGRFISVAPVDQAVELLTCTVNDGLHADDLLTALAHRGAADGVRILEAALANAPNNEVREEWCELLFAVRTPEAMKAFERLAKRPKGKATFQDFAKRHRELILAKAATRPGKPRPSTRKRRS